MLRRLHVYLQAGGPGGIVTVTIVSARDVAGSPLGPIPLNGGAGNRRSTVGGGGSGLLSAAAMEAAASLAAAGSLGGNGRGGGGGDDGGGGNGGGGGAAGLTAPQPKLFPSGSTVDPFVEMRLGRETHRTPFVHSNAHNPKWNWQFNCRLAADIPAGDEGGAAAAAIPPPAAAAAIPPPAPSSSSSVPPSSGCVPSAPHFVLRDDLLHFSVLNAMTIGEPELLCSCKVSEKEWEE